MKLLISILSCLVFVNALVATPLLVECFQADGRYLLEILGHDPCHNPSYENPSSGPHDSRPISILGDGAPADPCLDLLLDNPGCTRICSDALSLPLRTPEPVARCNTVGAGLTEFAGTRGLRPERLFFRDTAQHIPLTLRI